MKAYQNNLNTHKSYAKFRQKRLSLREKNKKIAGLELTETLNNYAQTGTEYTKKLNQSIWKRVDGDFYNFLSFVCPSLLLFFLEAK